MRTEPAGFRDDPSHVSQLQVLETNRRDRRPIVLGQTAGRAVRPLAVMNGQRRIGRGQSAAWAAMLRGFADKPDQSTSQRPPSGFRPSSSPLTASRPRLPIATATTTPNAVLDNPALLIVSE